MTEAQARNQEQDQDLVRVARIGKPHGIRGEVTVQLFTDAPEERFAPGADLSTGGSGAGSLTVRSARWNKEILVVAFEQSPDRNAAEALRGTELFAAPDAEAEDDAWYEEDLLGLEAVVDGVRVGTVTALLTGEVQDLLEIELTDGHRALVPFVEEIVPEVDVDAGQVVLTPPPGLLRVNADDDGATDEDATVEGGTAGVGTPGAEDQPGATGA